MNVLTISDLSRITECLGSDTPEFSERKLKREHLKKLSDDRVRKWPDTLASKRQSKLEWKRQREEIEELRRLDADRREAELRDGMRRTALARSESQLREQSDRIRSLRSQELYTEVVATRKEQVIEMRERRREAAAEEARWHEVAMHQVKNAAEEEEKKSDTKITRAFAITKMQSKQCAEMAGAREAARMRDQGEDEKVKRMMLKEKESEEKKNAKKTLKEKKMSEEINKDNINIRVSREQKIRDEQVETLRRKQEQDQMRFVAEARAALEKRKRESQLRLMERAAQNLENVTVEDHQRFEKQVKEKDDRQRLSEEAKMLAKVKNLADIYKTRQCQIELSRERTAKVKEDERNYYEESMRKGAELEQEEKLKEEKLAAKNMEYCKFLNIQCAENKAKLQKEVEKDANLEKKIIESVETDNKKFLAFAMKEIERFKAEGKDTHLLKRAMNMKDNTILPIFSND